MVVKFLESNGLHLEKSYKGPPFIIVDRTSYGPNSQSTRLIHAGYNAYAKKYRNAADLVRRFNLISTQSGLGYDHVSELQEQLDEERHQIASAVRAYPKLLVNLRSTLTDGFAWHGAFQKMEMAANGKVRTKPGDLGDANSAAAIIAIMVGIKKIVSKKDFLNSVQEEAYSLGYEFPLEQIKTGSVKKIDANLRRFARSINATLKNLGPYVKPVYAEMIPRLSPNAAMLGKELEGIEQYLKFGNGPKVFRLMLYSIDKARQQQKIGKRDLRHLFAQILVPTPQREEYAIEFAAALKALPHLQHVWSRHEPYFADVTQNRFGGDAVPKASQYFRTTLATSASCLEIFKS
jgi:hypothetical protein